MSEPAVKRRRENFSPFAEWIPSGLEKLPLQTLQKIVDYIKPTDVLTLLQLSHTMKEKMSHIKKIVPTPCDSKNWLFPELDRLTWNQTVDKKIIEVCGGGLISIKGKDPRVMTFNELRSSPFVLEHLLVPLGAALLPSDDKDIPKLLDFFLSDPKLFKGIAQKIGIIVSASKESPWLELNFLNEVVKPSVLILEIPNPEKSSFKGHLEVNDLKEMFSLVVLSSLERVEFRDWVKTCENREDQTERLTCCGHTPYISGIELSELDFRAMVRVWSNNVTLIKRHWYKVVNKRRPLKMEDLDIILLNIATPNNDPVTLNLDKTQEFLRELPHRRFISNNVAGKLTIDIFWKKVNSTQQPQQSPTNPPVQPQQRQLGIFSPYAPYVFSHPIPPHFNQPQEPANPFAAGSSAPVNPYVSVPAYPYANFGPIGNYPPLYQPIQSWPAMVNNGIYQLNQVQNTYYNAASWQLQMATMNNQRAQLQGMLHRLSSQRSFFYVILQFTPNSK